MKNAAALAERLIVCRAKHLVTPSPSSPEFSVVYTWRLTTGCPDNWSVDHWADPAVYPHPEQIIAIPADSDRQALTRFCDEILVLRRLLKTIDKGRLAGLARMFDTVPEERGG